MSKPIDYEQIPSDFMHCLNERCLKAGHCMRQWAARMLPAERLHVNILNPRQYEADGGEACPHFFSDVPQLYGKGFERMLDEIPRRKSTAIKSQMLSYFGRSVYYRSLHGERLVKPAEQVDIRRIFHHNDVQDEPRYDTMIEHYDF